MLALLFYLLHYGDWLALVVWVIYMLKHYDATIFNYQLTYLVFPLMGVGFHLGDNPYELWFVCGVANWVVIIGIYFLWSKKEQPFFNDLLGDEMDYVNLPVVKQKFYDYCLYFCLALSIFNIVAALW